MKKRYSIVRVDRQCPEYREEDFVCPYPDKKEECLKCEQYRYGDTKEQMVRKIAQILFQESPHHVLYTNPDKTVNEFFYNDCLKTATKIVEFLGVCDDTN